VTTKVWEYNDEVSHAYRFSPFYLTTGRHPWKGFDIQEFDTNNDAAANFATRLENILQAARNNLLHMQEIMKNSVSLSEYPERNEVLKLIGVGIYRTLTLEVRQHFEVQLSIHGLVLWIKC
jgi:hypothetical protein